MINEAWGNRTNYTYELRDILQKWEQKKKRKSDMLKKAEEQEQKYPHSARASRLRMTLPATYEVFRKYPVSILADKLGYEIKMKRAMGGPNSKPRPDTRDSARFLENALNNNEVTPEQLAQWWKEYEENILKKQYFDPSWIIKQLDPAKLFDPYNPDSTYYIDKMIENPAQIIEYLSWYSSYPLGSKKTGGPILGKLSRDEKEEVLTFYTEPVNQEKLHELFKKAKNRFMKARPTLSSAVQKRLSELFDDNNVDYDGCDIRAALNREKEERNQRFYQGDNGRSEEAHSVVSLVFRAISECYKLDLSSYNHSPKEGANSDDDMRKFLKDSNMGLRIEIHKGPQSEVEHGPVASSSFWTYYKHDMDVKIKVYNGKSHTNKKDNYDVIFEKTYKGITTYSSYYSGGWN